MCCPLFSLTLLKGFNSSVQILKKKTAILGIILAKQQTTKALIRFICFPWWSIEELENLHADQTTNYMFWAITEAEGEVGNQ